MNILNKLLMLAGIYMIFDWSGVAFSPLLAIGTALIVFSFPNLTGEFW